jgi:hypothetical protein
MKKIELTQGKKALVDDRWYDELAQYKWYFRRKVNGTGYAVRMSRDESGKRITIYMHRVVNSTPDGLQADHINHDTLDNRASNLRPVTTQQNQWNRLSRKGSKSQYVGVSYKPDRNKWFAYITTKEGIRKWLGYFKEELDAHYAYQNAKEIYHGIR